MAKQTTNDLLNSLANEAADARQDMASAKSGIRRKGEEAEDFSEDEDDFEEEESEQDFDIDEENDEDDPDEESEEDEDEDTEEDDDEDEDDDDEQDQRIQNSRAAQRRIDRKKDEQISELQAKLAEFQEATTAKEQKSIEDEITAIAEEMNLDSKGLTKIAQAIIGITERQISSKLPPSELTEEYVQRQEAQYFDKEWRGFIPDLEKQYPRLSATQLEQAKDLMDEISHSEAGGQKITGRNGKPRLQPYPLDYILFKNKKQFDRILSNSRRHSIESANTASIDYDDEGVFDLSTSKGIENADKKYRGMETSGLRRGRSPKSRTI